MSLGFGVLSWKGAETLEPSLKSYADQNLLSLFDETVIFLPEQRQKETDIAHKYGLDIYGSTENLGILGGFKTLAEALTTDVIIMVENDCPLITHLADAKQQIEHGYDLLLRQKADIVRLRSRTNPGQDWGVNRKYREYYPVHDDNILKKTIKAVKRVMRPQKAEKLKGWSVYEGADEAQKFASLTNYDASNDCFIVDARYMPWTNQSIMIRRDFFLDNIIQIAEEMETTRRINGFKNLEIEMNSDYWRSSGYNVAIPKGIFTHQRIGDRGYSLKDQ